MGEEEGTGGVGEQAGRSKEEEDSGQRDEREEDCAKVNYETVTVISDGQTDSQLDGWTDREVTSWRLHAGH